ncbi:MAG TPA: YciI family protein [Gemmatimonadales bacterium]
MKYLCLIYSDEKMWSTMSKPEMDTMMSEYNQFSESIRGSGHYVAGEALQGTATGTTLRSRNGKLSTTDGPFAETKEQLGGFYLIEAKDLNDAIKVAQRIPGVKVGSIEIRPVVDFSKQSAVPKALAGQA